MPETDFPENDSDVIGKLGFIHGLVQAVAEAEEVG